MTPSPLLTTSPLPEFRVQVVEATSADLPTAAGLLVPHDGGPVVDVRDRPDRWERLALLSGAVRRGVPVLAWGTGAALAGRVLGAAIRTGGSADLAPEWAEVPRAAAAEQWQGEVPLLWRAGNVTAWAGVVLPQTLLDAFLEGLAEAGPRAPGTPLEAVGGEAALRPLLADFYRRARADDLLGPLFAANVGDWDTHLEHVTAFWVTLLGGGTVWRGNLNTVHAGLGIRGPHLARWLALFREAAGTHLSAEAAAVLISRAEAMGARLGQGQPGNGPHAGRVP